MNKKLLSTFITVLIASMLIVTTAFAATIDPINRTVTTGNFFVAWSEANPEEIVNIQWMGSPNLTNSAFDVCGGNLEYFGNSWVSENEGTPSFFFGSLVGWGTTGTWNTPNDKKVNVNSISSGCFGSANIPVTTKYHFYDSGDVAIALQSRGNLSSAQRPTRMMYDLISRAFIRRMDSHKFFIQIAPEPLSWQKQ